MGPICPECQTGKHGNCDGIGDITDDGLVACKCTEGDHPHRNHFFIDEPEMILDVDVPAITPENDPGIWDEAFPELVSKEWVRDIRLAPNTKIITDLLDVEVVNSEGEWVPIVPMPLRVKFGITRCLCGARRIGMIRYQEHYAYAHILGMESSSKA